MQEDYDRLSESSINSNYYNNYYLNEYSNNLYNNESSQDFGFKR
jgi:hypothetical protein